AYAFAFSKRIAPQWGQRKAGCMKMKCVCGCLCLCLCLCLCSVSGCANRESIPLSRLSAATAESRRSHRSLCAQPIAATTATSYAYPLKVSASGRYLLDQNNKPFRIQGDSAQSLIANLTYSEADTYLADRQAKGFNTANVNLL